MALLFESQTHLLRRCLFDAHNEVGVGFPEEAYHRAFAVCCRKRGIPLAVKPTGQLRHRGRFVHTFRCDALAWDEIVLELKAAPGGFVPEHLFQALSYPKFWRKPLGLLVNFGQEKVHVERVPWAEKPLLVQEHYTHLRAAVPQELRPMLRALRRGILQIGQTFGLGYGASVYARLLAVEWQHAGIAVRENAFGRACFEETDLGKFPVDALLAGERVVCCISALKENIGPYELGKTQAYLRALDLPVGLAVNFGKRALQIRGVVAPRRRVDAGG
ncbi:MAG: GxxExxY protein [Verrucomicrobiales bacterium]|nr:GxxExxY protein [Verrucomicrobiales bacterium]